VCTFKQRSLVETIATELDVLCESGVKLHV